MTLPAPAERVRTRDATWTRGARSWSLGASGRASEVRGSERSALLIELHGEWSEALAADGAALGDHVLTATERGRLDAEEPVGAPYRSPSVEPREVRYALYPWIEGGTLASALARARDGEVFSPDVVATLGLEIARGLVTTGALGVLSPNAVVLDASGAALVRGPLLSALVRRADHAAPVALSYTPPEQLRADPTWGAEARLFALGVMLHELCAGRPLFPAGAAAAQAIARWAPTLERMPDAPAPLRNALWLLLQRDPVRRASASAIAEILAPLHAPSPDRAAALLGEHRIASPLFKP